VVFDQTSSTGRAAPGLTKASRSMLVAPGVPNASDDDDALVRACKPFLIGRAGRARRHVVDVAGVFGNDGMGAPDQRQLARRLDARRQGDDR
jgi:hypothetical protein